MKKLMVILFAVVISFCLSSCQGCSQSGPDGKMARERAKTTQKQTASEKGGPGGAPVTPSKHNGPDGPGGAPTTP